MAKLSNTYLLSSWRYRGIGVLRMVFGVVWAVDAWFKWQPGSTDIGAAIIYVLVFAALFLANAGLTMGVDRWLTPALGRWGVLASGPLPQRAPTAPADRGHLRLSSVRG